MALEWWTYAALGERLGISAEAVRQSAMRQEWTQRTGSDGRAEVRVDLDALLAAASLCHPDEQSADIEPTSVEASTNNCTIVALYANISTLGGLVERVDERAEEAWLRMAVKRARAARDQARADAMAVKLEKLLSESAETAASLEDRLAAMQTMIDAMRTPPSLL